MVKVIKNEEKPETKEILAEAIVNIGKAVGRLKDNKLNRRGIVVLLQDATHYPKRTIEDILDALPRLEGWYCK